MCRISIINFLEKNLSTSNKIDFNKIFYDHADLADLKSHLKKIDILLENISICDPCVGSGAFPVTMMNEIAKIRFRLLQNKNKKYEELYKFKKHFIENNIYGVDIEPGAVEIAKLRLWLSLIVDIRDIKQLHALPNLDYKIMQGDSLIDEYHGISFEKKSDELFGLDYELEKIINNLQKKQNEYLNLKYTKSKFSKRKEVQEQLKNILLYVLNEQKKKLNFTKNKNFKNTIENIEKNINELSNTYAVKDFFFWKLFFSKIFNEKGGFDIVIANPPYVFTRDVDWDNNYKTFIIKKYLNFKNNESSGRVQTNKINLYIVFLILSLKLINENGNSCFILPNTILRTVIHQNFRGFFLHNSEIIEIVDLKPNAFVGVTTSPIIILSNTKFTKNNRIKIVDTNFSEHKNVTLDKTHYISQNNLKNNPFYVFNIFSKDEDLRIISRIKENTILLKNIRKYLIEGIVAKDELIHPTKINKMCKKFIKGGDIKKYRIEFNNEYLEYDRDKIHRARPDELWRAVKKIFIQRISGGNHPLVCAIDEDKLLGYASTNVLLVHDEYLKQYSYELLAVILNSKLINYFYSKSFSNGSEITVNISTSYLEEIPIPKIDKKTLEIIKKIESNYKEIIKKKNNYKEEVFDSLIYDLYKIDEDDRKKISLNY